MMYQSLNDNMIEIAKHHAGEMAESWVQEIMANPKTPSYHSLPRELCLSTAFTFYTNIIILYKSEKPHHEVVSFFSRYAEQSFKNDIPLQEAIYALTMLKRGIWLYPAIQHIFLTTFDQKMVVESFNRTIRLFDLATHVVIGKYEEIKKEGIQ
jgi:hypothetical protein